MNNTIRFVKYHPSPGKVICLQDPILHALPAEPQLLHSGPNHFVTTYPYALWNVTLAKKLFVNLLQLCPSVPSFVYALLLYLLLMFDRLFLSFTQFIGSLYCLNFDKFRGHYSFNFNVSFSLSFSFL